MPRLAPLTAFTLLAIVVACDGAGSIPTALRPSAPSRAGGKVSDPTATFYLSNDTAYLLRGDGANVEGLTSPFAGTSRYKDGECGVASIVHSLAGESGDATMNTGTGGKCPRRIRLTYALLNADGTTTADGSIVSASFLNVRKLQVAASGSVPSSSIPVGGDSLRTFAFDDGSAKCGAAGTAAIAFVPVLTDGTPTGADFVQVHRSATDTWTVTTQQDEIDPLSGHTIHHDKAYCKGNGHLYHLPLSFTIRTSAALTP